MARLSPPSTDGRRDGKRRDRGQIILIAGFVLAVIFVGLALVVNAAIFTGNLATRGETTGASDALLYRHELEETVANVTANVNEHNTSGLIDNVDRSLDNASAQAGLQHARRGRVVDADVVDSSAVVRARFRNNATASYTNASGFANWTVVTDADTIRHAEFNVTDTGADDETDAFRLYVNASSSSDWWRMAVFENASATDTYNVTIRDETSFRSACEPTATDSFIINLTAGRVNDDTGTVCTEALDGANRTYTAFSGKDVAYGTATNVTGNYTVTVESVGSDPVVDGANFDATTPTTHVWIDRLDVTYSYESAATRYNTTFEVRGGPGG